MTDTTSAWVTIREALQAAYPYTVGAAQTHPKIKAALAHLDAIENTYSIGSIGLNIEPVENAPPNGMADAIEISAESYQPPVITDAEKKRRTKKSLQDGETIVCPVSDLFKSTGTFSGVALACEAQTTDGVSLPTEAMCDAARWFLLMRDAGNYTWGSLSKALRIPTTAYIEEQIVNNPSGHITKWDYAECVWRLMATAAPKQEAEQPHLDDKHVVDIGHIKAKGESPTHQPVDSPMELLKLLGYVNAMIGYCQSLRVGAVISEGYMQRMNDHYIPNTKKACTLIAELVDRAQAPKRESSESGVLRNLLGKGFRVLESSDCKAFGIEDGITIQMYRPDWEFGVVKPLADCFRKLYATTEVEEEGRELA